MLTILSVKVKIPQHHCHRLEHSFPGILKALALQAIVEDKERKAEPDTQEDVADKGPDQALGNGIKH